MDYLLFISTFTAAAFLPGIDMSLALSLGLSVGFRKTLFMIAGGVISLMIVAFVCAIGVGTLILNHPDIFKIFKILAGLYILYVAYSIAKSNLKVESTSIKSKISNKALFIQGFVTDFTNPKAWIFMATLLPPFLDKTSLINSRLFIIIALIGITQIIAFVSYAGGGAVFRKFMNSYLKYLTTISAILLGIVGIWLIIS
ncbi:LysE family translocator [Campylobacter corcagiensis]|uniref:LysE family translocator n=1 Tax=Campylobacter corcagiensis TaxID=1448857 RepID=A0A7M1LG13_9BACT|nr:LysE family translocator [Campylobacter corcagiensis]QKF64844.1 transporter, LysE family [Campylobacter corcagiensis]QOQ86994.1 LysE family translocator [Campylobacter corcagiensis]